MLPLRIELEGFLTYRQKQTLDFRDDWLWAITGDNGVGKSALFDAITYVLYGQHRGGEKHDDRLMSQGAHYTRAAFDFGIGQDVYRVERTITRRRGRSETLQRTRCAYRLDPDHPDRALAILGTEAADGLRSWVHDTLGLEYEAFISSVLLKQGEADRFVTSDPAVRKEILMQILDLTSYKELERAAREHSAEHERTVRRLKGDLAVLAGVTAEALAAAERERNRARQLHKEANDAVERATAARASAQTYEKLDKQRQEASNALRKAEAVLAQTDVIEDAWRELSRLRGALPTLGAIVLHQQRAAVARAEAAGVRRQAAQIDVAALEADSTAKAEAAGTAERNYTQARQKAAAARQAAADLSAAASAGRECAERQRELDRATGTIRQIGLRLTGREAAELFRLECSAAERAAPVLGQLATLQNTVRSAAVKVKGAEAQHAEQSGALEDLAARARALRAQEKEAALEENTASVSKSGLEAEARLARKVLEERHAAKGDGTCRRCGQRVDPAHIQREIEAARVNAAALAESVDAAAKHLKEVEDKLERLGRQANTVEGRCEELRDELRRIEADRRQHEQVIALTNRQIEAALTMLPDQYRTRIADEAYPSDRDIAAAKELSRKLPGAEKECRALAELATQVTVLEQQNNGWRARIAELRELYPEAVLASAPARYDQLAAAAKTLADAEERAWSAWQAAKTLADTAQEATRSADLKKSTLIGQAEQREGDAKVEEGAGQSQAALLDDGWRDILATLDSAALDGLKKRATELAPAEAKKRELEAARQEHHSLTKVAKLIERQIAQVPEKDRIALALAERRLNAAKDAQQEQLNAFNVAAAAASDMGRKLESRRKLEAQYERSALDHQDYKHLAQLLSKDGLQAWIVQSAQENIGHAANDFLSMISGGLLQLKMERNDDDLEIKVTDFASAQDPLEIKFISGSQRFRTAVAVALAIGQYSGGGSRQIRSVIIDEGFGGLDENGRKEMIDQLKGLRGLLDRVILVSHHEAFLEAFPRGYHIEKLEGTSRARLRDAEANMLGSEQWPSPEPG